MEGFGINDGSDVPARPTTRLSHFLESGLSPCVAVTHLLLPRVGASRLQCECFSAGCCLSLLSTHTRLSISRSWNSVSHLLFPIATNNHNHNTHTTINMSDIDNLVDMGFDREKATLAMKKAGNCMIIHLKTGPLHILTPCQWELPSTGSVTTPTNPSKNSRKQRRMELASWFSLASRHEACSAKTAARSSGAWQPQSSMPTRRMYPPLSHLLSTIITN